MQCIANMLFAEIQDWFNRLTGNEFMRAVRFAPEASAPLVRGELSGCDGRARGCDQGSQSAAVDTQRGSARYARFVPEELAAVSPDALPASVPAPEPLHRHAASGSGCSGTLQPSITFRSEPRLTRGWVAPPSGESRQERRFQVAPQPSLRQIHLRPGRASTGARSVWVPHYPWRVALEMAGCANHGGRIHRTAAGTRLC